MAIVESKAESSASNATSSGSKKVGAAPSIGAIMNAHGIHGGQSAEAADYINRIRASVEASTNNFKIEAKRLGNDENVTVFSSKEYSVILQTDAEKVNNLNELLVESDLRKIYADYQKAYPKHRLLNTVACNKFMYGKHSQMAMYIKEMLSTTESDFIKGFSVDSFSSRYRLEVDTDLTSVKQFFETNSPNATRCVDFGFTANIVDNDQPNNMGARYDKRDPMFAVGGYVDFIEIPQNTNPYVQINQAVSQSKYQPIIHITEICSAITSAKILALAIPLAGEIFVSRGLWKSPFMTLGRTDVNIGNLLIDYEKKKPYEADSATDVARVFTNIEPPIFCIDIMSGHATIPGISRFANPSQHGALKEDLASFLQIRPGDFPQSIAYNVDRDIVGVMESSKTIKGSGIMDTRDISYLWAVQKLGFSDKVRSLMRGPDDPVGRFELVRSLINGEVYPAGLNMVTMLDGKFVSQIAMIIASRIKIDLPSTSEVPQINIANFVDQAYKGTNNVFTPSQSTQNFQAGQYINY